MIKEIESEVCKKQIEGTVNEVLVDLFVDTGATKNYISESSIPVNLRDKLAKQIR